MKKNSMNAAAKAVNVEYGDMVFARGVKRTTDTRATRLNNNVLVVGTSGCGKTGGYVVPNLQTAAGSIVVADTKGMLCARMGEELREKGFKVVNIDFVRPERSAPYNPLDGLHWNRRCGGYRQVDLAKIAVDLIPDKDERDIFWIDSARNVLVSLMAFVLETLPRKEQHFGSVTKLYRRMTREIAENQQSRGWEGVSFFTNLESTDLESLAVRKYRMYSGNFVAEKCWASIAQFVSNALDIFNYDECVKMMCRRGYDLSMLGREKTAMFVNISDTDRSMDGIVNIFYTQLFQGLCEYADNLPGYRLPVPVHIMLDDFAATVNIPDFDKIISVIRSRDISVSVILQSLSQLDGMYNDGQASTIINNCDTMLYLGGQDVDTARFFAEKAGRLPESILTMPQDRLWLFVRGHKAELCEVIPAYSTVREEAEAGA